MDPRPALASSGRWLLFVRTVWAVLVMLSLALFVAAVPAVYLRLSAPPEAVRESLARLGLSIGFYAAYLAAVLVVFSLVCFAVAAAIARRRSADGMALLVSLLLVLLGAVNAPNAEALKELYPALAYPVGALVFLLCASFVLFLFVFPDGRFVPRWSKVPVLVCAAGVLSTSLFTGASLDNPSSLLALTFFGGLVVGVIVQVYRYLWVSDRTQRQQTKWVVFGTAAAIAGQLVFLLLAPLFPPSLSPPSLRATPYDLASVTLVTLSYLLVPLSIGVAILRYRLWDIDIIINRTLVYGALTAGVAGTYVLVVGGLGTLLQARGNILLSVLATGLVAVLFAPLRDLVQRGVNRLVYGERDDPYAVLSRLGERLEGTLAPEAVLPTVVRTAREALKLPYAAIALGEGESSVVVAESGSSAEGALRLPLVYQGETLGELLLAPRSPGESFSPADRHLLGDLARQAGVAVYAVRLTNDLQRSRERLVNAREEERRRLRRDLHDGLGPTLGSLPLKLDVADDMLEKDPAAARALLRGLKAQAQSAVADIRHLVYALRPPALDDLGLVGAIGEAAAQYGANGLRVSVEAPERLPSLPAAVEVAAYRIAQEALTNVVRHAGAGECSVRLTLDEENRMLRLEIEDDGRGLSPGRGRGVGIASMRERAAELGGECVVESSAAGGTRVRAELPCVRTAGSGEASPREPEG